MVPFTGKAKLFEILITAKFRMDGWIKNVNIWMNWGCRGKMFVIYLFIITDQTSWFWSCDPCGLR